jgi:hypothetical protein
MEIEKVIDNKRKQDWESMRAQFNYTMYTCLPFNLFYLFVYQHLTFTLLAPEMHHPPIKPNKSQLHNLTVSTPQPPPPLTLPPLPPLIHPEHTTRKENQAEQIPDAQCLGLKHILQPGEIDDQYLARKT